MGRRITFAALVLLPLVLAIQAGQKGRDAAARDVDRQAALVEEIILHIEGMTWFVWPFVVKRALEGLDGVEKAEVSFRRAEARVEYDPQKVTVEDMIQKVRDSGFKASIRAAPK